MKTVEHTRLVFVGGARGVGKTSALSQLGQRLGDRNVGVVFGSKKHDEICLELHGNDMFGVTKGQNWRVINEMARRIKSMPHEVVLLDGHFAWIEGRKIIDHIPKRHKKLYDAYILLDVDPEVLLSRRGNDNDKRLENPGLKRPLDLRTVKLEVSAEKKKAIRTAAYAGKKLHIIDTTTMGVNQIVENIWLVITSEFGNL